MVTVLAIQAIGVERQLPQNSNDFICFDLLAFYWVVINRQSEWKECSRTNVADDV